MNLKKQNDPEKTGEAISRAAADALLATFASIENPFLKRAALEGVIRGLSKWIPVAARSGKSVGLAALQEMINRAEGELQKLPAQTAPTNSNN